MKEKRSTVLYNFMLPIWLLVFWPSYLWLFLIPANYLIDRLVLRWSLKDREERDVFCRKHTWKICLAGFAGDFFGALFLFAVLELSALADSASAVGSVLNQIQYGIGFNPFHDVFSFFIVVISIALAAVSLFFMDRAILKKAGLLPEEARRSALKLAVITAPWLYLIPSNILYSGNL